MARLVFANDRGDIVETITLDDTMISGASLSFGSDLAEGSESLRLNYVRIEVVFQGHRYGWDLAQAKSF